MSSTSEVITLSDMREDFISRARQVAGTVINTVADRYLNTALRDMHVSPGHKFQWAVRRGTIITHAPYSTGTVAISANVRTTVTGTSTLWNTTTPGFGWNNVRVGGKIMFGGLNEIYEVATVTSDTALTITSSYTGDALTAGSYTYMEDEAALAADFSDFTDVNMFSSDLNIPLVGYLQFYRTFPRNFIRGRPKVATKIQLAFSGSTAARYRIVFSPVPDAEYTIPYHYITSNLAVSAAGVEQTRLVADDDEPIVPVQYRIAIIEKALQIFYRDYRDDDRSDKAGASYADIMARASNEFKTGTDRPRLVVVNRGRSSRARGGRFDVGGRFDRMD